MRKMKKLLVTTLTLALTLVVTVSTAFADGSALAVNGLTADAADGWTVNANSASVAGRNTTTGTLTLTATTAGTLSLGYSYSGAGITALFGGNCTYTNTGSAVVANMAAGDQLTIAANISSKLASRTLTISNITFDSEGVPVASIGATTYTSVEAALNDATSGDTVYLVADATITESCTIPSGVTLLVPYSADDNGATNDYDRHGAIATETTDPYKTLTVNSGVTLTVANGGKLVVNAKVMGYSTRDEGCVSGTYGKMVLDGNLTVANGGTLYARGYIKGSGSINAQSGASIYQLFQLKDWRGGSTTLDILDTVFPVNSYLLENIQVDTTYVYGAKMYGQYFISAGDQYYNDRLPFLSIVNSETLLIGADSDECLFKLSSGATVDLTYSNSILTMTTHGSVQTGAITLNAATGISVATINSAELVCPFSANLALVVDSNSTFTFNNDFKILPGASIQVNEGGTLTVNGGLYIYDHDAYLPGFTYGQTQAQIGASATLSVNGTLNGTVYTSAQNCGNITVVGYTASAGDTTTIKECLGGGGNHSYTDATFYACVLTSAVVEEETVEEAPEAMIEEAVEEPVEEIVEEPAEETVVIIAPEVIIAIEEAAIAE